MLLRSSIIVNWAWRQEDQKFTIFCTYTAGLMLTCYSETLPLKINSKQEETKLTAEVVVRDVLASRCKVQASIPSTPEKERKKVVHRVYCRSLEVPKCTPRHRITE